MSPTFSYDRPSDEIGALTADLLATTTYAADDRVVCYRVSGDSSFSDIGRFIECQVFSEAFSGNDAAFMAREYGPYEPASTFFISIDRARQAPVGALRIIRQSAAGLKTLNDLARPDSPIRLTTSDIQRDHGIDSLDEAWDVGTVAILRDYRRRGASVSLQLYRGMYVTALEKGVDHLVAVIDKGPLLALTDYLAIPFAPLCGSDYFSYLGSPQSRAVYGYVPEFAPVVSQRLSEVQDDPHAVRAIEKILKGTDDQALLFRSDYKN